MNKGILSLLLREPIFSLKKVFNQTFDLYLYSSVVIILLLLFCQTRKCGLRRIILTRPIPFLFAMV